MDKDPKGLRLSVRLTDRSLAYVLPLGGLVPMGVIGALVLRDEVAPAPPARPMLMPPPARPMSPKHR